MFSPSRKVEKRVFMSGKRSAKTFGAKIGTVPQKFAIFRKKAVIFRKKRVFPREKSRFRVRKRTKISFTAF